MSSKPNLKAFFDTNKKKKAATKDAQPTAQAQTADKPLADEAQQEQPQPKASKKQQHDFESSDEEIKEIQLDQNVQVLNKTEFEAQKRKQQQQEENDASGWKALENQSKDNAFTKSSAVGQKGPLTAQAKVQG